MDKEFSKSRKGYDRAQVDAFVRESNAINASLRERVEELTKKLEESQGQLLSLKQKQDLIVRSIMGAVQKSEQIESLTRQKYEFDMAQLRAFHDRWLDYYNKLIAKFPLDSQLRGLNNFNRNMFRLLNSDNKPDNKLIAQIDEQISNAQAQFLNESARLGQLSDQPDQLDQPDQCDDIPIFNPEETIRSLIRRQIEEESGKKRRRAKERTTHDDDLPTEEGFSYEEALNPKQELSEILKELGVNLD